MAPSSPPSIMDQHRPPILTITKAPDTGATPLSSPPDRKFRAISKTSSLETVPESGLGRTRPQYVPYPADAPKPAVREPSSSFHNSEKARLADKHSQHYHDALHERSAASAAASVRGEALIYAELKTNVKASTTSHTLSLLHTYVPPSCSQGFLTDLSTHRSTTNSTCSRP
jgi:hypothetical protein